ncbi:uncharacterized mitochondrial protein-like protein [Tanacetum coccineum]
MLPDQCHIFLKQNIQLPKAVVNTAKPKAVVNAARPKAVLNAVKGNNVNAVKASAYPVSDGLGPKENDFITKVQAIHKWIYNLKEMVDMDALSVDLKNIVPKGGLTCLFAKATSDEYELWHRRLGHINFKTMNKLVKGNLVRDHLGKFDSKANEGFFVGYSINSIAFRVFNSGTRIVEENLHVQFIVAVNQSNDSAGTKACDDVGKARMETVPGKDYILLPLWTADPPFSQSSKSSPDAGFKASGDDEKKVTEELGKEGGDSSKDSECNDDEDVGAEDGMNNLDAFMPMDVKSAFLYGKIEEEVYVCQPPGFEDPDFPNRVYKVEKALYGLHQALKAWYETLSTYLLDNGFQRGKIYKTLFIRRDKGLQVKQKEDGIFISQDKYVTEILKKFGFTDVKTASTPMETQKLLLKDEDGEEVDVHLYRSMIGSLMYLTSSRPDIMFAVCACARYQVNPKVSHLHAVKRIFRYLKGQPKLGLWYPKDSPFDLVAYTDSDYAGASLDRKSTIGDEAVNEEMDDNLERAATTTTS